MIDKARSTQIGKWSAAALIFASVSLALIVICSPPQKPDKSTGQGHIASDDQYVTGVMNGVRLRIPKNYILGPVQYKKREDSRTPIGGNWPPIDEFGILVRFETFEPIRSEKDRADWNFALSKARPSFEEHWLMIDFDISRSINTKENIMKGLREDIPHWGPFVLDPNTQYGLTHYESVQTIDSSPIHGHFEYFFDNTSPTNIECETSRIKVPPFDTQSHCYHLFFCPAFGATAQAIYTKKDLPRWREIEQQAQRIANNFIEK